MKSSVMAAMLKFDRRGTVEVANAIKLPVSSDSAADFNCAARRDLDRNAVMASEPESLAISDMVRNTGGNVLQSESADNNSVNNNIALGRFEEDVRMRGESLEEGTRSKSASSRNDAIRSIGAGQSDRADSENFGTFMKAGELCGESDARGSMPESPNRNHRRNPSVKARALTLGLSGLLDSIKFAHVASAACTGNTANGAVHDRSKSTRNTNSESVAGPNTGHAAAKWNKTLGVLKNFALASNRSANPENTIGAIAAISVKDTATIAKFESRSGIYLMRLFFSGKNLLAIPHLDLLN